MQLCKMGGVRMQRHVLGSDVSADACSAANKEAPVNEVEFNDGGQGDEDDLPQTFSDDGDVEGQPIPRATRCEGVEQTPRCLCARRRCACMKQPAKNARARAFHVM